MNFAKFLRTPLLYRRPPVAASTIPTPNKKNSHQVKSVQIWSYFWSVFSGIRTEHGDLLISIFSPNTGKYGPEITSYLDTFHSLSHYEIVFNVPFESPKYFTLTRHYMGSHADLLYTGRERKTIKPSI